MIPAGCDSDGRGGAVWQAGGWYGGGARWLRVTGTPVREHSGRCWNATCVSSRYAMVLDETVRIHAVRHSIAWSLSQRTALCCAVGFTTVCEHFAIGWACRSHRPSMRQSTVSPWRDAGGLIGPVFAQAPKWHAWARTWRRLRSVHQQHLQLLADASQLVTNSR